MGRDLAQVSDAALRRVTGQDGRSEALLQVKLPALLLGCAVLVVLRHPGVSLLPDPTLEHPRPGGHTGVGVYAAVCGGPFDVGEAQHLRVHQVSRAKVLIVAVAGGVAGKGVAAGVAGVFVTGLVETAAGRSEGGKCRS